jgi:hypothetical protein
MNSSAEQPEWLYQGLPSQAKAAAIAARQMGHQTNFMPSANTN